MSGPNSNLAVERLSSEISRLSEEQAEAMRRATYIGMTKKEAHDYEERRRKHSRLVSKLSIMSKKRR